MNVEAMPAMLTSQEVADVFRVKVKTIWEWRRLGKPPHAAKVGGRLLYPRDEILALLQPQPANDRGDTTAVA